MANGYVWWNYSSAVYSGYVWNRSGTNEMWTFIQNLDDACLIVIDGQTVLSGRLGDMATRIVTVPVTPGPHSIELRFTENTGGDGPWSGVIPWAIGIKEGAVSTTWQDYAMLADPGDGSLLTTGLPADYSDDSFDLASGATLDLGGGECAIGTLTGDGTVANGTFAPGSVYRVKIDGATSTCVTFNGVDLANLTVMPADAASAEPTATTYVIATGSINTKPALSGFPSKYKLIIGGNGTQLLLTSQGGAVLLLK